MNFRHALLLSLAAVCICVVGLAAYATLRDHRTLPPPSAIGGPFSLTATDGHIVTDRTYAGKWKLIYFGYTFCPDACPTALAGMSMALQTLGATAEQLQPIFITVDPRRDTASALTEYLKSFDARIVGLRGTLEQTRAAAAVYRVYVKPQNDGAADELIDHSAYLYVMDPKGRFVDVIEGNTPGEQIAGTVRSMMDHYL